MNHALATLSYPTYDRISEQNDLCRRALTDASLSNIIPCKHVMTTGVGALSHEDRRAVMHAVSSYSDFSTDNDPYGEHDFGSFEYQGQKLFWKIDCYDTSYRYGSEDPADLTKTRRVLTIMLASEY